jgi:hypothetical protein
MSVPEFLNYAADYVLRHHRELKRVRAVFRKGAREILSAVRAADPAADPNGPLWYPEVLSSRA